MYLPLEVGAGVVGAELVVVGEPVGYLASVAGILEGEGRGVCRHHLGSVVGI